VLGPIVTDIAPGYDEITSSIGGAIASAFGADFICYVTPSEHIGLPTLEEVRKGIISAKIAAHAGDIVKGIRGAKEWDNLMSKARKELNWEEQMRLAVDKSKLKRRRKYNTLHDDPNVCTMCGKYCAIKLMEKMKKNANITP
jgi:phosphomethylpyrimidine synthase